MKVSKRDISIVMILLGAIALFCVYQFYYRDKQSEVEKLQKNINSIQSELDVLHKIDEQKINTEINGFRDEMIAMVKRYPMLYRFDDEVIYLNNLEKNKTYGVKFYEYLMTKSTETNSYRGTFDEKSVNYVSSQAGIKALFYTETYEGCKKLINAIYADKNPKNLQLVKLTFDRFTGEIKGELDFRMYGVTDYASVGEGVDTNAPYKETKATKDGVVIGVGDIESRCIFGPTASPIPTLELLEEPTPAR